MSGNIDVISFYIRRIKKYAGWFSLTITCRKIKIKKNGACA
ncbi:hypothetical protein BN132_1816 [Cronobacter turicensis 564]|nr:hypothetical protein BN132_1816 [Cronobacter turicensis 564]